MSAAIMLFILTLILFVRGGSPSAETDPSADSRLRRPGEDQLICWKCRGRDFFTDTLRTFTLAPNEEGSPPA